MKTTEFKLGAKVLHLFFNGEAMFQLDALDQNLPAHSSDWFSRMLEQTAEGKRLLCKVAHILATQGELCRRYLQYPHERIPTEEEINLLLTPMAWVSLRSAAAKAVDDGFGAPSHGSENDDIDLGLMELEKKTNLLR